MAASQSISVATYQAGQQAGTGVTVPQNAAGVQVLGQMSSNDILTAGLTVILYVDQSADGINYPETSLDYATWASGPTQVDQSGNPAPPSYSVSLPSTLPVGCRARVDLSAAVNVGVTLQYFDANGNLL